VVGDHLRQLSSPKSTKSQKFYEGTPYRNFSLVWPAVHLYGWNQLKFATTTLIIELLTGWLSLMIGDDYKQLPNAGNCKSCKNFCRAALPWRNFSSVLTSATVLVRTTGVTAWQNKRKIVIILYDNRIFDWLVVVGDWLLSEIINHHKSPIIIERITKFQKIL